MKSESHFLKGSCRSCKLECVRLDVFCWSSFILQWSSYIRGSGKFWFQLWMYCNLIGAQIMCLLFLVIITSILMQTCSKKIEKTDTLVHIKLIHLTFWTALAFVSFECLYLECWACLSSEVKHEIVKFIATIKYNFPLTLFLYPICDSKQWYDLNCEFCGLYISVGLLNSLNQCPQVIQDCLILKSYKKKKAQ